MYMTSFKRNKKLEDDLAKLLMNFFQNLEPQVFTSLKCDA